MDINFNKVYFYDNIRPVLVLGDLLCPLKDNGPMNKNPIKAHKGLDNKIVFRALGPDRVPFDIACNQQVYARIIDPENRKIICEKLCTLGPAKGIITLNLDGGDIIDAHPGLYNMVLVRTEQFVVGEPGYYVELPIFTDYTDNVSMTLEITEQAFKAPLPSVTLEPKDWTPDIIMSSFMAPAPCFYSVRIAGGRVLNHKESVHSFSTYTENFTGRLEIWGTLEETPDPYLDATRWFKIYPSTMSVDVEYFGYTGTQAWTFSANFMWLKFRYFPSTDVLDPGVMKKLIVRV
jgi:hypothetical protein